MGYFINSEFGYYENEGDQLNTADVAVPQRPDATYLWQNGAWVQSVALARAPLLVAAQAALDKSDTTILRCVSAGVAVPSAWHTYRSSLRAIVNGSDLISQTLPAIPAYSAST